MEEELLTIEQEDEEIATVEEGSEEEILTFEEGNEGTNNYNNLTNKPKINDVELKDNKSAKDLGLQEEMDSLTNLEIEEILNSFV